MSGQGEQLDSEQLKELFSELSASLKARGVRAQLFVVGGAAMALAYDGQRITRDVDAAFAPAPEVREIAAEIGLRHGLEPDWLNDGAKGFMPAHDEHPQTVFESEYLLVQVPSPEYLLAMKLYASRDDRDLDDAATLFRLVDFTSTREAEALLATHYPVSLLLPRHKYVLDEVAQRATQLPIHADVETDQVSAPNEVNLESPLSWVGGSLANPHLGTPPLGDSDPPAPPNYPRY